MSVSAQSNGSGGVGTIINDQYRISKKLGGGSFGDIYLGIGQQGEKVAIKFEKHTTRCPQLRHEYKVYRELQNCEGFGRVYYFGTHNSGFNVMVMDLLGGSLEDLFTKCGRRFSLKTVLQVADQLLERIETMHNRHLIHRDVKPANFVLGPGRGCQTVFSIDFGLSTRYRHPRTLQHIPYREGRSLTGTPRYASINNHLGVEQSRRDDLESIGYVLIYFLKGSLPWQGLKARNAKRKYKMILERKQAISIQQLCHALPQQFAEYLAYCRSLKFEAKPNISYLRGLFRELYKGQGFGPGPNGLLEWDWTKFEAAEAADGADIDGANTPHMLASSGLGRAGGGGGGGTEAVSSPFNAAGTQRATAGTPARSSALGYGSGDLMLDGIAGGGGTPHAVPRLAHTPEAQSAAAAAPPPQHSLLGGMRMPSAAAAAAQQEADIGWGAGAAAAAAAAAHNGYSTYPQAAAAAVPRASGVAGDSPRRDAAAAGKDNARSSPAAQSSSGGWGMWNLRAKSSGGGFWGGGVRGWSGRDAGGGGSGAQSHGHEAAAGGGGGGAATPPLAGAAGLAGGAKATTRPHTAHGGRVEVLGSPAAVAAPGHVVASARGVMRYREEQGRSGGAAAAAAAAAGTLPMQSAWAGSSGAAAGAAAAAAAGGYKVMGVSAARPSSSGGWDRQPSASTGSGAYGSSGVAAGRPSTSAGVTAGSARNPYVHGGIGAGGGGGAVVTASSLLSGGGGGSGKLQQRPVSAARSRGQGVVVPSRKKFMRPPTAFAAGVNY